MASSSDETPLELTEADAHLRRNVSYWGRWALHRDRRRSATAAPPRVGRTLRFRDPRERRVCLFAHWDPDRRVDPSTRGYIEALGAAGCDVVVISASAPLGEDDVGTLSRSCLALVERENRGLDFGAWKQGLAWLEGSGGLGAWDQLVLANDSVYGPLFPLDDAFAEMSARGRDFWGLTDCFVMGHHLQSYFLVFTANVVRSAPFRAFWGDLRYFERKLNVVRDGEVRLSAALARAGLRYDALRSCDWIAETCGSSARARALVDPRVLGRERELSPPLSHWRLLLVEGRLPFLKSHLLYGNPYGLPSLADLRTLLPTLSPFDLAAVDDHLRRLGRPIAY